MLHVLPRIVLEDVIHDTLTIQGKMQIKFLKRMNNL